MRDTTNARRDGAAESLSVQVQGGGGEPDRLFVLSRGRGDSVEVREFRFAEGDSAGPLEYTASARDLLADFERAHHERRRLSEDMYSIRHWLNG